MSKQKEKPLRFSFDPKHIQKLAYGIYAMNNEECENRHAYQLPDSDQDMGAYAYLANQQVIIDPGYTDRRIIYRPLRPFKFYFKKLGMLSAGFLFLDYYVLSPCHYFFSKSYQHLRKVMLRK